MSYCKSMEAINLARCQNGVIATPHDALSMTSWCQKPCGMSVLELSDADCLTTTLNPTLQQEKLSYWQKISRIQGWKKSWFFLN